MSAEKVPVGYTNGTSFDWNTRGQTIAAATVLPALGLISVVLRFWSRLHRRAGLGLDDAFIVPALLCVIGLGTTLLVGVAKNVIAHTTPPNPNAASKDAQLYQITPPQELVEKIEFVFFLISVVAYGFIKLSVLFFYRRIFVKGASAKFDIVSKVAIWITSAWTIAFFLIQLFKCGRYIDSEWGPLIDASRCLDSFQYTDALFVSDLITDLLVYRSLNSPNSLRVSNPSRWPRKTYRRRRYISLPLGPRNPVRLTPLPPSEGLTTLLYWGMLEAGISLIATNLPSLHFLVTEKSLQPFAASIRTAVSFSSLRSQASKAGTGTRSAYSKVQQNGSKAPAVPVLRKGWENGGGLGTVDTFAMYDMERAVEVREPGLVHVACEMWQQGNAI
ncbi:hypothetical protein HO133_009577 [Letharia lupina]|uniref:Rhodopsin domain-containing protein n=1 Tax=Letharia lupina TaxID=560253 RepID=A0A8H6FEJ3_9LECA|nr:uncharacterized protein HO133_009577 [Letharia lupina]KAF6225577.1 hypothetical protein HO133_009577 [Letharia lupina]